MSRLTTTDSMEFHRPKFLGRNRGGFGSHQAMHPRSLDSRINR